MPTQADVQAALDKVEIIGDRELFGAERMALEELMDHVGLAVLLGLVAGTRQGFYAQLSNWPLTSEAARYQAAVLQGQIKGLDLLSQIMLDQFPPAGTTAN